MTEKNWYLELVRAPARKLGALNIPHVEKLTCAQLKAIADAFQVIRESERRESKK